MQKKEVRCVKCNSVLFVQGIVDGSIEIKCRKSHCRTMNLVDISAGAVKIQALQISI